MNTATFFPCLKRNDSYDDDKNQSIISLNFSTLFSNVSEINDDISTTINFKLPIYNEIFPSISHNSLALDNEVFPTSLTSRNSIALSSTIVQAAKDLRQKFFWPLKTDFLINNNKIIAQQQQKSAQTSIPINSFFSNKINNDLKKCSSWNSDDCNSIKIIPMEIKLTNDNVKFGNGMIFSYRVGVSFKSFFLF